MNKQSQISFSTTSAELNAFHALLYHAKFDKFENVILSGKKEKSNIFVERLKKRFH
ncbi:MAG: hypothetical protein MUF75_01015 [Bacteroidia bacterium]|jgi:hypothetical protein|nr:hypothetical protein [Bacteroidia bacterium]